MELEPNIFPAPFNLVGMKLMVWQIMIPRFFAVRSFQPRRRSAHKVNDATIRLFGSKPGTDSPKGHIHIDNYQKVLPSIDLDRLRTTMSQIRKEISYESYDVNLILLEDGAMQEANLESRGVDKPTDILSFPFHEAKVPGELEPPMFDIPDYYNLGDMLIDVPYVIRGCQSDQQDSDLYQADEEDRGVSLAMSKTFDPEQRLHQLLVHGMLHLVGYDHEEDGEYLEMVEREEAILKALELY